MVIEVTHSAVPGFRQAYRSLSQRDGAGAEGGKNLAGGLPGNILISTPETHVRGVVGLR